MPTNTTAEDQCHQGDQPDHDLSLRPPQVSRSPILTHEDQLMNNKIQQRPGQEDGHNSQDCPFSHLISLSLPSLMLSQRSDATSLFQNIQGFLPDPVARIRNRLTAMKSGNKGRSTPRKRNRVYHHSCGDYTSRGTGAESNPETGNPTGSRERDGASRSGSGQSQFPHRLEHPTHSVYEPGGRRPQGQSGRTARNPNQRHAGFG